MEIEVFVREETNHIVLMWVRLGSAQLCVAPSKFLTTLLITRLALDSAKYLFRLYLLLPEVLVGFGLVIKVPAKDILDLCDRDCGKSLVNFLDRISHLHAYHNSIERHSGVSDPYGAVLRLNQRHRIREVKALRLHRAILSTFYRQGN